MTNEKTEKSGAGPTQVLKKLQENRLSLHIARLPEKTKKAFIALAEEEFCGDYGMCLKFLMDDIPSQDIRLVIATLEDHERRLQALENTPLEVEEPTTKKMCDGSTRTVRGPGKK